MPHPLPDLLIDDLALDADPAPVLPHRDAAPSSPDELGLTGLKHAVLRTGDVVALAWTKDAGRAAAARLDQGAWACPAEYQALRVAVLRGLVARQVLAAANQRLVLSVARKYLGRGLELRDLHQEGNLGLLRAIEHFDYRRGHQFSTYAIWWIRQAILRAIQETGRTIRLPAHVIELATRLTELAIICQQDLGRSPTPAEIAAAYNERAPRLITTAKVRATLTAIQNPVSLELSIGDEGDGTLGEVLEDTTERLEEPQAAAEARTCTEDVTAALAATLTSREIQVLELRFGLGGSPQQPLERVGEILGVTRERVRQIEAEALRKLRAAPTTQYLRAYLPG